MKVFQIEWISKDSEEALVFIGDDEYECTAFCHPCCLQVGNHLKNPLLAYDTKMIVQETDKRLSIKRQSNSLAHELIAKVTDVNSSLIKIGSIFIELDIPLPSDIRENEIVSLTCSRLDVIA
ncbi:MAG TPA: hypothetical protein ENG03_05035 [Thioploca sp.]|nr:MAG: hypothetical protein DRR19_31375 [Gammaproteobacteria bacterium]HDN26450.1 hypothetical protein [Thioploca sp.]